MRRTVSYSLRRKESSELKNKKEEKETHFRKSSSQFNIRNSSNFKLKHKQTPSSVLDTRSKKPIPEQINAYLKKREDVEIVVYFEQYLKQFETKAKLLQEYIYNSN